MALTWSHHPLLDIPSKEDQVKMGAERLLQYWESERGCHRSREGGSLQFRSRAPTLEAGRRTTQRSRRAPLARR